MKCLLNDRNEEIVNNAEIINEVKKFYENLYKSKEDDIVPINLDELLKANTPKLSEGDA